MSHQQLDRKTVFNLVYTQQATRMADAYDELKAENDRLRKAGDKLVFALEAMDIIMDMDSEHPEIDEWNAVKEGKV